VYSAITSHLEPPGFLDVPFEWSDEPLVALDATQRLRLQPVYALAGAPVESDQMLLRSGVAERLQQAVSLLPESLGMLVLDAHRPLNVQAWLWNEMVTIVRNEHPEWDESAINAHARRFVAYPELLPNRPTPHSTGGAVDITLFDIASGETLDMGSGFDEPVDASVCDHYERYFHPEFTDRRRMLFHVMTVNGFANYPGEWWHFEFGTLRWAAATGAAAAVYNAV
jgi:D-alanyl-D-alanine dipeptidase